VNGIGLKPRGCDKMEQGFFDAMARLLKFHILAWRLKSD
jgi:hypothetical protein